MDEIFQKLQESFNFKFFDMSQQITSLERIVLGLKSQMTVRTVSLLEDTPFNKEMLKTQIRKSAKKGLMDLKDTKKQEQDPEYTYYSEE